MKYVRIQRGSGSCWGVLDGEKVRTLVDVPYENLVYDGEEVPLHRCRLLAPCQPTKVVCIGKNYVEHAREMGSEPPGFPILFLKAINTLNHPDGEIIPPSFVKRLDYEGELGVVIRRRASKISSKEYADYVLGYTCLNDVTARDVQQHDGQWTRAKSMDGFCPVGPWVVDDVDHTNLNLETRLNGKVVQRGSTQDFITDVPQLLEFITSSMTLEAGDVVATGTPAGIGPMHSGDVVEVEISNIGILRNRVR